MTLSGLSVTGSSRLRPGTEAGPRAFAAERGVDKVHDSYQEVIDDPDVDVVYNCLVNSLHAEWNLAALRAGKHVLSEKPMSSKAAQARQVRDVADATDRTVVEGFHYLHHPVNLRLRDLVTSGQGEPFLVNIDDSVANAELVDTVYRRAGLGLGG